MIFFFLGLAYFGVHSSAVGLAEIVADSVRDFSGSQGTKGWSYGYWDRKPGSDYNQDQDFQLLPFFGADPINGLSTHSEFTTGPLWYLEDGRYYTSIWAEGGHAQGTRDPQSAEHWAVRRWVSSVIGPVEIGGHAGKVMPWGANWGGETIVQIVVDGKLVFEAVFDDGGQGFKVKTSVKKGSKVDFLIGPKSAMGVIQFTAKIHKDPSK